MAYPTVPFAGNPATNWSPISQTSTMVAEPDYSSSYQTAPAPTCSPMEDVFSGLSPEPSYGYYLDAGTNLMGLPHCSFSGYLPPAYYN